MIQPENEASARVARRLGMCVLRNDVLLDTSVVVYWLRRDGRDEAVTPRAARRR